MLLMHAAILNQQGQAGGGRSITYSVNRTSYSTVQVQPQPTREFASIAAVWVDHTLLRASSIASARVAATSQGCKNPLPKKSIVDTGINDDTNRPLQGFLPTDSA